MHHGKGIRPASRSASHASARLDLALETGALTLPGRGISWFIGPRAGDDLSALPKDRVVVLPGSNPITIISRAGAIGCGSGRARPRGGLVCLPRAKAEARALLAEAARCWSPAG